MVVALRQEKIANQTLFVSVVVPVLNEHEVVSEFVPALARTLATLTHNYEIVMVDDGSQDETSDLLIKLCETIPNLKILTFSRNFGKEIALAAGLEHASGEVVVMMDADFQHPLPLIAEFIRVWGEGYDMVYGVHRDRDHETVVKRNSAKLFYWILSKIAKVPVINGAGDFRLLDRCVVQALCQFQERGRFMKGLYGWVGFKSIAVSYDMAERAAGSTRWRFLRLLELAITGITSFSDTPLRMWGLIGIVISLIALIYAIYFMIVTLIYGVDVPGFPSIIVAVMFFGGIQLLSIGILGEYIGRIFTEVKQRPPYLIARKHGFDSKND